MHAKYAKKRPQENRFADALLEQILLMRLPSSSANYASTERIKLSSAVASVMLALQSWPLAHR